MSSPVQAYKGTANIADMMLTTGMASGSANNQRVKSDAQIIAQVVTTEIKPSGVAQTSQPTREAVAKAAADLQQFVQSMGRNLNFSVDDTTGYHVVKVVNPTTGELVRQLPSEELLQIARDFERLNSVLVNQRA
ncbi:MAG: flagellar protein FlaG [Burkholderiaceae bacterium]|jgi:flagellar protein FlaG|nr:flagellar protein FlaG [Burkholderiaceae bacterium]